MRATPAEDDALISMTADHVVHARRIVERQRTRIEGLRAVGASTLDAEQTLAVFEANL